MYILDRLKLYNYIGDKFLQMFYRKSFNGRVKTDIAKSKAKFENGALLLKWTGSVNLE